MGLMKELGIREHAGNKEAMKAVRINAKLLQKQQAAKLLKEEAASRRELQKFSWAVPCSAELAEAGITGQIEPNLDKHDSALEAWLEREYDDEPAPLKDEAPF